MLKAFPENVLGALNHKILLKGTNGLLLTVKLGLHPLSPQPKLIQMCLQASYWPSVAGAYTVLCLMSLAHRVLPVWLCFGIESRSCKSLMQLYL